MLSELEKKVTGYIEANSLFCSNDKILLAVSGGTDSTALLYIMNGLKSAGFIKSELLCAHLNHLLRGIEADADEKFVIKQAVELGLTVITRCFDVRTFAQDNKLSIETAARQLRLKNLIDIAEENNCGFIATAHQKNDNAETILQRLSRGTGYRGLAGIWPERIFGDNIRFVRPLLCAGRDEIEEYLQNQNLKWRTDRTNTDLIYRRNFIRHRLLPELQKEYSCSIVEQLSELSEAARGLYKQVCSQAEGLWPKVAKHNDEKLILNLEIFQTQSKPVKIELIRRALECLGSGQRDLTQGHYRNILKLADENATGKKIELPGGFTALCEYKNVFFCRVGLAPPKTSRSSKTQPVILKVPGKTKFDRYIVELKILAKAEQDLEKFKASKTNSIEWLDFDKVSVPLAVRFRQPGDRFVPLGLSDKKKVGKFLTASKIPYETRRNILIITDAEKIIWLFPIRISERVKVTDNTKKILQLRTTLEE
jgi:tRNA(Ile)-lysidine synthase